MYYVLFNYTTGKKEHDWKEIDSEREVIEFLHSSYHHIEVQEIFEVRASYRLGLIVTENYVKSTLEPDKEKPADYLGDLKIPEEAIQEPRDEKKHPLLKNRKEEPSAMEKIADDIDKEKEEELTDEEKAQKALERGDKAIAAAKKEMKDRKLTWPTCPDCKVRPMAPWNTKGKCSVCQRKKKPKKDDL